jgi:hypothetical protein
LEVEDELVEDELVESESEETTTARLVIRLPNPNFVVVDSKPTFWMHERCLVNSHRYRNATKQKVLGPLPDDNPPNWPQEKLNKLKNIRASKIKLKDICIPSVTFFPLFKFEK